MKKNIKEDTVTGVYIEPNKMPRTVTMDNTLVALQESVGGYIESVSDYNLFNLVGEDICIWCNEEGKIMDLPKNRFLLDNESMLPFDVINGNIFVCGSDDEGECISLTEEQTKKIIDYYSDPSLIVGGINDDSIKKKSKGLHL